MCRISNFHDEHEHALGIARDVFTLSCKIYEPPNYWGWLETGANMTPKEISRLTRFMDRCAAKLTGPGPVVRHFVSAIRKVAVRDKTVGENLLAVVMPQSVALAEATTVWSPSGWGFSAGAFDPSSPTSNKRIVSVYIPKNMTKGIEYAPNFACRGIAVSNVIKRDL